MIISFLQRRDPPILPSLQKVEGKRLESDKLGPSQFADDVAALRGCGDANKETLAQLMFSFFRHYGYEFDYAKNVVSVKEGRLLSREEKGWQQTNYWDKEAQKRLCVEEPFTMNRNLGNSADEYSWSGVHNEIRRAFDLLADGQQLDKCCEQYEFPQEEKPVFQRPPPRPAPTLRRSASQSGRPNHEPGSGRSRKGNNRNQSAQRAGNRRASSGASYGNPRLPLPLPFQSPPVVPHSADYFATKSNLHDQLFQQYQYLQAQQDALRSQLAQHAQQQQQGHGPGLQGRVGDMAGSPRHRNGYANGLPSPRLFDNPPQTAPLLPGYLYHYPARYPPPSPLTQSRSREGTNTNPSSPSMVSAVPAFRRQMHRGSVPDGSSSSARSQSQPGRSLPHPLTLQQHAHPGYDVSGVIPAPYQNVRASQMYIGHPGLQIPFSPMTAVHPTTGSVDSAQPKEYIGYYVGHSPQLGPQIEPQLEPRQFATGSRFQMPQLTLRDPPPQKHRRVTPELKPPMLNGRHTSRSPSPLGHLRSYSTVADLRSKLHGDMLQSPMSYEQSEPESALPLAPVDIDGPLIVNGSSPIIVNGSNSTVTHKPADKVNGVSASAHPELSNGVYDYQRTLPLRTTNLDRLEALERTENRERPPLSPRISPSPRSKTGPRLAISPNGTSHMVNGISEHLLDPTLAAPLLSPVAELRTPSPTHAHLFDKQESPHTNGFTKAAKMAGAKQVERTENEPLVVSCESKHERKGSTPNPVSAKPARSPTAHTPTNTLSVTLNQNPWQPAPSGKRHKKSKSNVGPRASQGQPMPVNEAERKGG